MKNEEHEGKIKSAVIMNKPEQKVEEQYELAASIQVTDQDFIPEAEPELSDVTLKPRGKNSKLMGLALVLFLILVIAETLVFTLEWFENKTFLGGMWLGLFGLLFLLIGVKCAKEFSALKMLKNNESTKMKILALHEAQGMGAAVPICEQIMETLPQNRAQWPLQVNDQHNDREVIEIFEQQVIALQDKRAVRIISQHSGATAAMVAASPLALMDMLVVLWRSLSMLEQLADCYGIQLSYWGRIGVLKKVMSVMVYAGVSELLAELGTYGLGASATSKLSAQLAQGIGAGVLTARLGLRGLEVCRPVPWLSCQKPKLKHITHSLVAQLSSSRKE